MNYLRHIFDEAWQKCEYVFVFTKKIQHVISEPIQILDDVSKLGPHCFKL